MINTIVKFTFQIIYQIIIINNVIIVNTITILFIK